MPDDFNYFNYFNKKPGGRFIGLEYEIRHKVGVLAHIVWWRCFGFYAKLELPKIKKRWKCFAVSKKNLTFAA